VAFSSGHPINGAAWIELLLIAGCAYRKDLRVHSLKTFLSISSAVRPPPRSTSSGMQIPGGSSGYCYGTRYVYVSAGSLREVNYAGRIGRMPNSQPTYSAR
jgi:hypothetical protein